MAKPINNNNVNHNHQETASAHDDVHHQRAPVVRQSASEFASRTTIHGLSYLGERHTSNARRCVWLLLVLVSLTGLVYYITASILSFYDYDSNISYSTVTETKITFPAVTFCSKNTIKRSSLFERYPQMAEHIKAVQYRSMSVDYDVERHSNSSFNVTAYEQQLYWDFVERTSPNLNDIFVECRVANEVVNCDDFIHPLMTYEGICFTFQQYTSLSSQNGTIDVMT